MFLKCMYFRRFGLYPQRGWDNDYLLETFNRLSLNERNKKYAMFRILKDTTNCPDILAQLPLNQVNSRPIHNFVPTHLLPKLICTKCKKYLSVFPIYIDGKGRSLCGRCPKDEDDLFRNELYETVAESMKFPCVYEDSGCLEKSVPNAMSSHESGCSYKKLECPMKEYNSCSWQGYTGVILEHFEQKHPTFILKEGTFELDFVNTHKENYLFPYGEDLYVVRRQAKSSSNEFICCVSQLKADADLSTKKYMLFLESGNRVHKYSVSQNINRELVIDGNSVRSVLHDPISVIAKLEIEKGESVAKSASTDITDDEKNTAVDYDQLQDLECPVCFYYLVPPIYQCEVGHSICSICKDTQTRCPTCRQVYKEKLTQNYTLEKVVQNLIYPCRHKKCNFATKAKDIRKHEVACIFGPFNCPLKDHEKCDAEMSIMDIYDHVANNHYESLLELETLSVPFEIKEQWTEEDNFDECYIFKHKLLLFKLCFMFKDGKCYWSVQLLGPAEECPKYKFELEILDNSGNNGRIYIKKQCTPLASKDDTFTEDKVDNFIYLELKQIKKFVVKQLTYRVRVIHVD